MIRSETGARLHRSGLLALAVAASVVASDGLTQVSAQGLGRGRSNLTGTYRLNTSQSDNSSTIADQVTRSLPDAIGRACGRRSSSASMRPRISRSNGRAARSPWRRRVETV